MKYTNGLDVRVGDKVRLLAESVIVGGPRRVGHEYTVSKIGSIYMVQVRGCTGEVNNAKLELLERAWIRNEGEAPALPYDTRVDILYNDGSVLYNAPFGLRYADEDSVFVNPDGANIGRYAFETWHHYGGGSSIHSYREHVSIPEKSMSSAKKQDPKKEELKVLL